jgi:hypothetical protein
MANQNPNGASTDLPLVGIQNSTTHRKEPRRTASHLNRSHDHLVLESKPHFMIILQLDNADPGEKDIRTYQTLEKLRKIA